MVLKTIYLTLFVLLSFAMANAADAAEKSGSNLADSLRRELVNRKGAEKITTQLELVNLIMANDQEEAMKMAKAALSAARSINNQPLELEAFITLGKISGVMENMELGEAYYDTALTIAEATGDQRNKGEILLRKGEIKHFRNEDIQALELINAAMQECRLSENFKSLGSCYAMMGNIFRINGLYDRAIEYMVKSRLNYEKAGFLEGYAWNSYLLGRIYADLKLPQKSLEYFQEAMENYTQKARSDGNLEGIAICKEQIGIHYFNIGNFEKANEYFASTMEIYKAQKSKFGLSNSNKNMGMIEYAKGNFEQAEKYLKESLQIKLETSDLLNIPTVYEYIGLSLIGKGQKTEGIAYLKRGLDLAISNNQKKVQLNIYAKLTEVYLSIHDLKNAISSQKKQIEIQDQTLSGTANVKMEQLQAIFELDKKNGQIVELERQNELKALTIKQQRISQLIMVIGILAALFFSLSIYWVYHKIRHKNIELKESNAAKDKFFAVIAHDLRGPAGNLASFLEYLKDSYNEHSPTELKKILLTLHTSAENVTVLLENLLIWAQSQLNKIEFKPAELNLSEIIQHATKGLRQSAENKEIEIKLDLDDQISVLADPNMVQTIVRNLCSNTIKFSNRGRSVVIQSGLLNRHTAYVRISDKGIGIEKTFLSNIFNIGNTLHTPGTENERSTGLGLILVKEFVEKNRGTISIESEKDKGTIVTFTLPANNTSS